MRNKLLNCRQLISLVSRPAEGSSNVATQQSSVERRVEKGKSRYTFSRGHSPSVSEDGRATSRNGEQRTNPASSPRSANILNVPDARTIQRPTSAGPSPGASSPPSVLQTAATKSIFAGFGTSSVSSQPITKSSAGDVVFGQPWNLSKTSGTTASNTSNPFGG